MLSPRESAPREWRAQHVPAQPFQAGLVPGRNPDAGVQVVEFGGLAVAHIQPGEGAPERLDDVLYRLRSYAEERDHEKKTALEMAVRK